ncbi:hypothetical protein D4764_19G0007600 [Takifugu flavidus]|uniref:Uncharacterized protein n=1 Tax=Takifugu flavidus TaxID=433684 RepID=A0A5C6NMY7_9TELE|nr:hypothetical protein D4764_19G0007600 [Takifugu flavidus]
MWTLRIFPPRPSCPGELATNQDQAIPASILSSCGKPAGMSRRRLESGGEAASCCQGQKVPSGVRSTLHFIKPLPNCEGHVPEDAPSEFLQAAAHGRAVMWRYRRVPSDRRVH